MAINFYDGRDKGQFYGLRIHISLKSERAPKKCIQEYISFVGKTKKQQKLLWDLAKVRERALVKEHGAYTRDRVKEYPFCGRYRNVPGAKKKSLYGIVGLYDRLPTQRGTKGSLPDWGMKVGKPYFNTYPPGLFVQVNKLKDGKRIGAITKSFNIRSRTDYYKSYVEAVDFLIEHRPHWVEHRAEMISKRPTWNNYLEFIADKFKEHHGQYPWVVKK